MKNCNKCLYDSNHPFGMTFKNSECLGCITHKEKYNLDWELKLDQLKSFSKKIKKKSKTYDCVIPLIGDAEDYFIVEQVLKLNLNPLIVSVNSYFLNDIGWTNLHNLITHFDLDSWIYNPDIITYKELIRTSLRKYKHLYLPWLQLHTSFPVHVAKEKSIPLVIWGGHQSIEQVGKFSHIDSVKMTSWSRTEHDLINTNIIDLIGNGAQVNERNLNFYKYPKLNSLSKRVEGIYLSNYIPWDPLKQNFSTIKHGFIPQNNNYSFDPYDRAGSSIYYKFHDILKYERLGYRKIKDHCSREIRHGRITKAEAEEINNHFSIKTVDVTSFFKWLEVTKSGMEWFIHHKLKNSRHLISNQNDTNKEDFKLPIKLKRLLTPSISSKEDFILYDKGIDI